MRRRQRSRRRRRQGPNRRKLHSWYRTSTISCSRGPIQLTNRRLHGEVAFTAKLDIYTRFYSASMVIYFLLTGRRPENDVKIDPRWRPTTMVSRLRWRKASDLLERMWAHDAEQRPSAGECAEYFSKLGEADEDAEESLQRAAVLPSISVYDDSSQASEILTDWHCGCIRHIAVESALASSPPNVTPLPSFSHLSIAAVVSRKPERGGSRPGRRQLPNHEVPWSTRHPAGGPEHSFSAAAEPPAPARSAANAANRHAQRAARALGTP